MTRKQQTILIVDDELAIRRLLCETLSRHGYECEESSSAEQALATLSNEPRHLVLLDVKMPGKWGIDILPEIRAKYPDTAVIMATAVNETSVAIECMKQGADDYICKPFDLNEVAQSVDKALGKRRMQHKIIEYQHHLEEKVVQQTAEMIKLAQALVEESAIALENARLLQEAEKLATTDPLTGLSNRRHFESVAERDLRLAIRHHQPLSIMIVDIDRFKTVNDTYGHGTGDKVLAGVANTCRGCLRITDMNVRLGGEEFAFLCPNTDGQGAWVLAERIRRSISELTFDAEASRLNVTVSIGISEINNDGDTLVDMTRRADQALYQAKNQGRNRTAIWENSAYSGENRPLVRPKCSSR